LGNLSDVTVNNLLGSDDPTGTSIVGRRSQILTVVRQYPDGASTKMVANRVGLSVDRTRQILDELTNVREIYKRELPEKINLYYPNGKLIHKYLQDSKEIGNQIFRVSIHEGRKTPRIQIQERKYTLLDGENVEGCIFVDFESIPQFTDFINQMIARFNSFKENEK